MSISCLAGCAHNQESQPEMTGEERIKACERGRHDRELFCKEPDLNRMIRDEKCWKGIKDIRKYCDQ